MSLTDQSTRIRAGEELDAAVIDPYLKAHIPGLEGTPKISQFPGGASNLTYLIEYPRQEFVLRRPPFGHKGQVGPRHGPRIPHPEPVERRLPLLPEKPTSTAPTSR